MPVGPDQVQHLEFTAEIAKKINNQFGQEIFRVPKPIVYESKIKSLSNPTAKMSKSDRRPNSCLYLLDEPEEIRRKIMRAVTDDLPGVSYDEVARPGVSSLISLYSQITGMHVHKIEEKYSDGKSLAEFKNDIAEALISNFGTIRESYHGLIKRTEFVDQILSDNAKIARDLAAEKLQEAKHMFLS